jgi:ribokinase
MFDVISVGSATLDVFAKTQAELITIKSEKEEETLIAYPCGTKILINDLDFFTGGGGTNTAVSFARLGQKTAFLGKLGKDMNARIILEELKREKVDFIGVQAKGQSGYSVVLDSSEDDRTILTYKGVNNDLRWKEINRKKLQTRWFYFSSMVGDSYGTLEKIATYAHSHGMKVAFNPSSYLAKSGTGFLQKLLRCTDLLVLNKEEAQYLVGRNPDTELLKSLTVLGPGMVIITDGKHGAHVYDKEHYYFIRANKVKIRETTGAGDAFASGFLAGYISRNSIEFGLQVGMANATSVIKRLGAKNKLLSFKEALKEMKKNHRVQKKKLR